MRVVSNARIRLPDHPLVERVIVSDAFDAADDWIADTADASSVVVTADILLADRCLKAGAVVIAPTGKPFTAGSIGNAVAVRAIMADLRSGGDIIGGPAPFAKADRSRFLQALDEALVQAVVDVSGRPYCVHTGEPEGQQYVLLGGDYLGSLTRHVFETLAFHAHIALHVRVLAGREPHHIVETQFKAFARAFRDAVALDPRETGVPSTKGSL